MEYEDIIRCPNCGAVIGTTYTTGASESFTCGACDLSESGELGYWRDLPPTVEMRKSGWTGQVRTPRAT